MRGVFDYDVAIVGAGNVGAAIARELARFELRLALVEAGRDVGAGTSKANTAILHTAYDAKPGTLEARLVARGYDLLTAYAGEVGIPLERTGALLVAWDDEQLGRLPAIAERAEVNGYDRVHTVGVDDLYRMEPNLGQGAVGALEIPDEHIVCPFTPVLAFATQAVLAGADLRRQERVTGMTRLEEGGWRLETSRGALTTEWVINAAGLHSDEVDRMAGFDRFTVTPRRGELIVFDKLSRPLVRHVILPVPTETTKGVLVSPTVFGNVVLGPTAVHIDRKDDTSSTAEGLAYLREAGERIMPELLAHEVTAVYVGLRAATEHADYQLWADADRHYMCAGGIRSTGLTSALAIAEYVRDELDGASLALRERPDGLPVVRMPSIGESQLRPFADPALVTADPEYGRIVCFCERVTRREIRDAARSPVPPVDLDGLRRRTRVLMGRCQGFFCEANVAATFAEHAGAGRPRALGARAVSDARQREQADVAIVGGGPAGLAAATALCEAGLGNVVVLERESELGGIPRHARHQGFGLRDLHRSMSGPRYAARCAELAAAAGADLRTQAQATGWNPAGVLEITSPRGRSLLEAHAVVIATGCRERPRAARLVPGTRPQGVITTGALQQLVYLLGQSPGTRAVVVGAEHVSFSALLTLSHGGARAVAMVTEHSRHQTFGAFRAGAALRFRVPIFTETALTDIRGRERVEEVELTHLRTGQVRRLACDLVVFTADWIPDHELAALAGAALDSGTRGPAVDAALHTTRPRLFAAGNLLHGAETADIAALSGRLVAESVMRYLEGESWPTSRVPIECESPLHWIVPNAVVAPGPRGHPHFRLRAREILGSREIEVSQDGRTLWRGRVRRIMPGRSTRVPSSWTAAVDFHGGPVVVRAV